MPVLLSEDQFGPWLSGEAGIEYLMPASEDVLQKWLVSKRVNSSRADAVANRMIFIAGELHQEDYPSR